MSLGLIDPFSQPVQLWNKRDKTEQEMLASGDPRLKISVSLNATLRSPMCAVKYIAQHDEDQDINNHINDFLKTSEIRKNWQKSMPSKTPKQIGRYQKNPNSCDLDGVTQEINQIGKRLTPGQFLFHGGAWPCSASIITSGPFSTSLCPKVAFLNALYNGKAYQNGRIDLLALEVIDPTANVFVFKRRGTTSGHENEILFAAGATIQVKSCELIRSDYEASAFNQPEKQIPIYVFHASIS
jgi:hypothetical protein